MNKQIILVLLIAASLTIAACGRSAAIVDPTPEPQPAATATDEPPPPAHPASGLTFSTAEGTWLIDARADVVLLTGHALARISPNGQWIAYEAEDSTAGASDIWLIERASGDVRNLTNTPDRYEVNPMWWPGREDVVVFGSDPDPLDGVWNSEYPTVIGLDGTGYQVLDENGGGLRALSADGQAIAYVGYDTPGAIYRWGEGVEDFDPSEYGVNAQKLFQPTWSPDGRLLAWNIGGDLLGDGSYQSAVAVFDLQAKTGRFFHIFEPAGGGTFPSYLEWSPDGEWLAFVTFGEPPAAGRAPNLWVIRPDGSDETYVGEGLEPTWSYDSGRLAFLRTNGSGFQELWLAQVGTWETQVVDLPYTDQIGFLMDWFRP
ncbi:MAG: PD40 domain-containing protein [Anaerolineales bacterium]|nr:PD40 domain-containing protein [Anaerolineales bacterium]